MRSRTRKYAPFCERGFFAHFIQISPSAVLTIENGAVEILRLSADGASGSPGENLRFSAGVDWRTTASKPPPWMLTYVSVRSASRRGFFLVLHPNIALNELAFERASLSTPFLFRRRNYAPLSQTCTVGEFSPTLASRGAQSECRATSQSARFRRRAPLCGGRLACRAVAPLRVVKMRRRSLRSSFLRNYRKALSFSLRVNEIGQERRTEGIAIVTQSVDRVIPPPVPGSQ